MRTETTTMTSTTTTEHDVPAVELRNVSARYGDVPALTDISLPIPTGETTAILGPNGAGKTSLLRRLSALDSPSGTGDIFVFGEKISGMRPDQVVQRGLVQVPENRQVFSSMTVMENLELGAHVKAARRLQREGIERACELFPILRTRQKQIAGTLSGGEQQMLAIGRALMSNPKILLLDEPSLGIAPAIVEELFASLAALHEQGMTLILAEQNAVQALELARSAFVLSLGRISVSGGTKEVLSNPEIHRAYLGIDAAEAPKQVDQ